jgi:hypothetical protein
MVGIASAMIGDQTATATSIMHPSWVRCAHTTLQKQKQLNANAMSVQSQCGGSQPGHVELVLTDTAYMTMAGVAFVMPDHPGPASIHLAAATTAQITETTNRQFFVNLAEFNLAAKLRTALKALLIAAIDDVYIAELCDKTMEYANVTVQDLLAHLTTTYGAITFTQLDLNLTQLDVEFNPDEPMEVLWKRVKECRRFAAGGQDPILEVTAVRKTLAVLKQTGVFSEAVRDWSKRPNAELSWAHLRTDFNIANTEREFSLTAANAGYHRANSAQNQAHPQQANDMLAQTIAATAALTTATNAANNANNNRQHPSSSNRNQDNPRNHRYSDFSNGHYCWTHGLGRNSDHTSSNCATRAARHVATSTISSMQGGNNAIARNPREPAVFKHPEE